MSKLTIFGGLGLAKEAFVKLEHKLFVQSNGQLGGSWSYLQQRYAELGLEPEAEFCRVMAAQAFLFCENEIRDLARVKNFSPLAQRLQVERIGS